MPNEATTRENSLMIDRLPDGGFVVRSHYHQPAMMAQFLFASTTIDEALKYIKKRLTA